MGSTDSPARQVGLVLKIFQRTMRIQVSLVTLTKRKHSSMSLALRLVDHVGERKNILAESCS